MKSRGEILSKFNGFDPIINRNRKAIINIVEYKHYIINKCNEISKKLERNKNEIKTC